MADGIYVGMAGAAARAEQLESIADNLANAETPGYKAGRPAFQSFLPGKGAGVTDKVSTAAVATGTDLSGGAIMTTDNPLDVVPRDGAFLLVRTPTGQQLYTRNGRLAVAADGTLHADGRAVMGLSGNPIQLPPNSKPLINERGVVSVGNMEIDRLALFQLQGNVTHVGASLYAPGAGGSASLADVGVSTGQLEMGNATPLEATVQMISAQRQFELATQAIQTYRRLDDRVNEVGRLR